MNEWMLREKLMDEWIWVSARKREREREREREIVVLFVSFVSMRITLYIMYIDKSRSHKEGYIM